MKKNIFQIFCIVLFFVLFWYFYGDEYWEYQEKNKEYQNYTQSVENDIQNFSLETITETEWRLDLHVLPDRSFLSELVSNIDNAEEKVYVEVYIFTERDMRDALIRAYERWVDVKILLENNPYQAPYINDAHYNMFEEAGLDVKWSDPLNYSLNHSKMLIIDDSTYVSTGNFSYSLFTKNRDFMIEIRDESLNKKFEELFFIDYNEEVGGVIDSKIVLSPDNSRDKMTNMLLSARESIDFYFPYINDDAFKEELFSLKNSSLKIRWIVGQDFYDENNEVIQDFTKNNIILSPLKTPKAHGKAILIDKKYLYIGSINFSTYSFDENREIWLIISDTNIIQDFIKIFESDF